VNILGKERFKRLAGRIKQGKNIEIALYNHAIAWYKHA